MRMTVRNNKKKRKLSKPQMKYLIEKEDQMALKIAK